MASGPHTVLHLVDSGGVYGAERVILNLSAEMERDGRFRPVVGCIVERSGQDSDLREAALGQGLATRDVVVANRRLPMDLKRTARQLREDGIALIHTHGYKPVVFAGALGRWTGIPVLATCHLWSPPGDHPLKMRVMVALSERLYRRFPAVVAVSEPIRRSLLAVGVREDRVSVVPNGVPVPAVPDAAQREALRRELGLDPRDRIVLNAGRLTLQKAQSVIVEAAALLRDRGWNGRFLIVGQGELEGELRAAISARGLQDTVRLLGFRRDIVALLALADVFVLPSLFEGMPMSLLEATALKVPTVATPVGDVPRLLVHGESGLLVPCGDAAALAAAVVELFDEPERAARLAAAAHDRMLAGYSSAAMFGHYAEEYARLVGSA